MWKLYTVSLQVNGPFAASIPHTEKEISAMLEHRMPNKKPDGAAWNAENMGEVASSIAEKRNKDQEEPEDGWLPGWAGFLRDDGGIYYEGRCIRGHMKDCALAIKEMDGIKGTKNFRSKFVQRVYIDRTPFDKILLYDNNGERITEPHGMQERFIQVMTARGPRSSIKYVDYVDNPRFSFGLKVLEDGIIELKHLEAILEYGGTHGLGQERSQGWGQYDILNIEEVKTKKG